MKAATKPSSRREPRATLSARAFLQTTSWATCTTEFLAGDASARKYFRVRLADWRAVLMDASQNLESVGPFIRLGRHLASLGFSVPALLAHDASQGLMLLEDFGDQSFAQLLDRPSKAEVLLSLAVDVLLALHRHPQAIPSGLRAYDAEKMLEDLELFLQWRTPAISERAKAEFRTVWREVLPSAHQVPVSLLLRDYHVANLMFLPKRTGIRQVGLLDFQDAYQGPITYDLVSLLEDARRDIPVALRERMVLRYLEHSPRLDARAFEISRSILAAQRHTRVLGIFERLSRRDAKPAYKQLHSPRVEGLLKNALRHPVLAGVKRWMDTYAT